MNWVMLIQPRCLNKASLLWCCRTGMVLLSFMLSFLGCQSDFEKGKEALRSGNREGALAFFKNISSDDPDAHTARSLVTTIQDSIAFDAAQTFYAKGQYAHAETFFEEISSRDSSIDLKLSVCKNMEYYEHLQNQREKYAWLSRQFMQYTNKLLRVRYSIPKFAKGFVVRLEPDSKRFSDPIPARIWVQNWLFFIVNLEIGASKAYRGMYVETICNPAGYPYPASWRIDGGIVDGEYSILNSFASGGYFNTAYLFSDVPIPSLTRTHFLVKYVGEQDVRLTSGELKTINRFEVVASLSCDWNINRYPLHSRLVETSFVLTESKHLNEYLEEIYAVSEPLPQRTGAKSPSPTAVEPYKDVDSPIGVTHDRSKDTTRTATK